MAQRRLSTASSSSSTTTTTIGAPLKCPHQPASVPVGCRVEPPAVGIPPCPSLAAKRLAKEWGDLVDHRGLAQVPCCLAITQPTDTLFHWRVTMGRRALAGQGGHAEGLVLEVVFPPNYPFSAPAVTCLQFALFIPRFVPEWSPRMTAKTLLLAVAAKLEHAAVPANHIDPTRTGPEEVSFGPLGLSCVNESAGKAVLLCAKPLDPTDRAYWTVEVHQCTEMDVGVATLWDDRPLMQYVWSYLEVGVIQVLLLPEGRATEGRREKLNSYEYAAEEVCAIPCEPFEAEDSISVFYDGPRGCLSFFKNGALQHVVEDVHRPGHAAAPPPPRSGSRRGRRERLLQGTPDPFSGPQPSPPSPARPHPGARLFPALSLSNKMDSAAFSFEPPLWTPETHRFFPRAFAALVPLVLFALEKRGRLERPVVTSVLAWVGAGFHLITIPTVAC